jgi:aryl-alcohol dehydrogenase-like predicted oxidoreductase
MKRIKIPGVDQEISQLILGTMMYSPASYDHSTEMLDTFFEAGGNTLDTAHIYGGGNSERLIGLWMKERGNRDKVFLIDKGGHPYGGFPNRVSPEYVKQDLDENLTRLDTDYIDLYMLHRDDPDMPVSTIIDYLNEEINAGRIRTIAASNWEPHRIVEANTYAEEHELRGFVACSNNISLAVPMEPMWGGCVCVDDAAREWHKESQFPLMPWSSQARGFFSGAFTPENRENGDMVRVYYNDGNFERLARAKKLGEKYGYSAIQVSLAYSLNIPFPVFPIVGPATLTEMDSSLGSMRLELSDAEMEWLNLETDGNPL